MKFIREHLLVEETQLFPGKRVSLLWAEELGRRPWGRDTGDASGVWQLKAGQSRAGVREDSSSEAGPS